jgi:radical SAM protein with 4Fe4S-binding SPASM domain
LKSVAVTVNVHELRAMQQFAEDLGVAFKFDGMMNPRIDCSQSPLAVRLSPEQCVALDVEDPRRMHEWREFASEYLKPANPPERADEVYHCGGGVTSFAIDPYGGLSICVLSQRDKFDLRAGSLGEGWHGALGEVRRRKITAPTKCTMCALKSMCGMCPATGELENGDPEAPVDFLCRVAHLRAYAFDLSVAPHGSCEYCPGGVGYEETMRSVERLRHARPVARALDTPRLLPMLAGRSGDGCGSGGCSSCGAHR